MVTRVPLPFSESMVRLPPCSLASASRDRQAKAGALMPLVEAGIDLAEGAHGGLDLAERHAAAGVGDARGGTKPSLAGAACECRRGPRGGVNFTALPRRLIRICLIRSGSAIDRGVVGRRFAASP